MLLVNPVIVLALSIAQASSTSTVDTMQSTIDVLQTEVRDLKNELSYYEFHQFPYGD